MYKYKFTYLSDRKLTHDEFYKMYDFPRTAKYLISNILWGLTSHWYICPHCDEVIFGTWMEIAELRTPYLNNKDNKYYIAAGAWEDTVLEDYTHSDHQRFKAAVNKYMNEFYNSAKNEEKVFLNLKICPICGGELKKGFPFSYDNSPSWKALEETVKRYAKKLDKSILSYISMGESYSRTAYNFFKNEEWGPSLAKLVVSETEPSDAKNKVSSYIEHCAFQTHSPHNRNKINLSNDELKDYILSLINIENNIISLSKRLESLYLKRIRNAKSVTYQSCIGLHQLKENIYDQEAKMEDIKVQLERISKKDINPAKVVFPTKPDEPILKTPGFFNKKRIIAENEQAMERYNIDVEKYNKAVEECKAKIEENKKKAKQAKEAELAGVRSKLDKCRAKIDKAKAELKEKESKCDNLPTPAMAIKHFLDTEIATVEDTLNKLFAGRSELYSYGIVFDKYRNLVALSSFYEYLMSGRCESLEGQNGAYNIYESEIRLNCIISQLDVVITSLEEIKQNQYMLYSKLDEMNSTLSHLSNSMDKAVASIDAIKVNTDNMNKHLETISKNTDVIAHNTAVTAYYSKVNAELTDALGVMVALK